MLIAGIDPGLNGAVSLIADTGTIEIYDMPSLMLARGGKNRREVDAHTLADALERAKPDHVFIEQIWGMMPLSGGQERGQGAARAFAQGKAYGIVLGVVATLHIPMTMVTPQRWKKALGVPAPKDGARARASQLLPSAAHYWARVKDDGRAESALIALYGKQCLMSIAA